MPYVLAPEFVRIQKARQNDGLPLLPTDEALDAALQAAGITHCLTVPYPFTGAPKPAVSEFVAPAPVVVKKPRPTVPAMRRPEHSKRNAEIREKYATGIKREDLARSFNLSKSGIGKIVVGIRPIRKKSTLALLPKK